MTGKNMFNESGYYKTVFILFGPHICLTAGHIDIEVLEGQLKNDSATLCGAYIDRARPQHMDIQGLQKPCRAPH